MSFSFSGRTQARTSDSHGKFPCGRLAGIAEIQIVNNGEVPIWWIWNSLMSPSSCALKISNFEKLLRSFPVHMDPMRDSNTTPRLQKCLHLRENKSFFMFKRRWRFKRLCSSFSLHLQWWLWMWQYQGDGDSIKILLSPRYLHGWWKKNHDLHGKKPWRLLAPCGPFCMSQAPKDHGPINEYQHHRGPASILLARS
jgi:hypothetical protein